MNVQFPTLVYRSPGPHAGPGGSKGYEFHGVKDAAALLAVEADGWCLSLDVAVNGKPKIAVSPAEHAAALGIAVDGRWSDKRLAEEIKKAEAKLP